MAIEISGVCQQSLLDSESSPTLAITLATLFAVYLAFDSLLAAVAIFSKSTEAEELSRK
jgi:hypothetical protein